MKGQQQALSAVLVTAVLISVIGSVFLWGVPLVQKNRDIALLQSSEVFMDNLNQKIKRVANTGGRETTTFSIPGTLNFDGDKIELVLETTGTIYATGAPIPLGLNGCDPQEQGTLGENAPEVLCVTSQQQPDGTFRTTYVLSYITLESDPTKTFLLDLTGSPVTRGPDHEVVLEHQGVDEQTVGNRKDIITHVSISVV